MRVVSQKDSAPLTAKSGNPNMPSYDKTTPNRPLAPTLSASANRGNKPKTPLTPKVSSARPASRQSRSENTTPNNIKDDSSTLGPTSMNGHNVTARPGTRKTRFDSISHSPSGTPIPSEGPRLYDPTQNASGLGISGMERDTTKRSTVAFSPSNSELNCSQSSQSSADSKFFFASDVKPQSHSTQQTKPAFTKKPSAFFHANGDKVPKKQPPRSGASTGGSTLGEERGHAKFFHANGTPELGLSPSPQFAPPRPSSVLSTHSRVTSPRLAHAATTSPSQRPTSPQKLNTQYASISTARSPTPLASPILPRPKAVVRGQSANNITQSRRTSGDGGYGHQRNTSTGSSMERLVLTRKVSSGGHSTDITNPITITEPSSPASISHTDEIPEGEEEEEEDEEEGETEDEEEEDDDDGESLSSEDEVIEEVLKAGGSIERMNELAAIARNERKVLDLEITNSSLAAINRTLEREMRRQTAELRRYKRLSRSGRLSMATGASSRATSGTLSVVDEREGNGLSDISQGNSDLEDEEDDDEEEDPSSEEDLIDAGTLSPGAVAEHDLKHRKKDEKRLRLDLSKHQQLLIDSQKMNQSLKKCLGWTEELINEGKRALEYKVKTSDIEPLAPRVLAPDEFDDNDAEMDNEGMSAIGASLLREARKAAAEQKDKANNLAVPTETDEQLEDLTQDIQFALFASGESSEMLVDEKSGERPELVPIAPPTSPWVSTFTSRLQTRS
ncbi:uncharacterized protein Bfra_007424 [Botrytis fragariae]|uniref:Uncharacterized protein n=1 Tax=Botrytis fragariae TaxID=1964551 RepID=A0A8H6AIY1_9HELO|nr:uncharacterized protein Bfra_007424 [Botrytis fragariae]KAF5868227.1 hypothetical protein Bfra_007424 [Botrytis fragariae]